MYQFPIGRLVKHYSNLSCQYNTLHLEKIKRKRKKNNKNPTFREIFNQFNNALKGDLSIFDFFRSSSRRDKKKGEKSEIKVCQTLSAKRLKEIVWGKNLREGKNHEKPYSRKIDRANSREVLNIGMPGCRLSFIFNH